MEHPTTRIRQLAEEIGRQKRPDAYAIGRARGYLLGGEPAEVKLANISAVFEAWALTLNSPDRTDEVTHSDSSGRIVTG